MCTDTHADVCLSLVHPSIYCCEMFLDRERLRGETGRITTQPGSDTERHARHRKTQLPCEEHRYKGRQGEALEKKPCHEGS